MYKVFINTNVILLTRAPEKRLGPLRNISCLPYRNDTELIRYIDLFDEEPLAGKAVCFYHHDLPLLWKKFRKNFSLVRAGGGIVQNEKGRILFIFRNGKWDLPKGKAEPNELIETTALREVKEECNIRNLFLIDHLTDTYHTYGSFRNKKLKKTSWFRMYSEDKDLLPQLEEGITRIKWVKPEKLDKIWENTYPSIVDVMHEELRRLAPGIPKEWHTNVNFE